MNVKIVRSKRKSVSLEVSSDLTVIVRVPLKYPEEKIPALLGEHSDWINRAIQRRMRKNEKYPEPSADEIEVLKRKAHEIISPKVEYFSRITGLVPTSVKITGAKKRFGSCSGRDGICFSYLLMRYPHECIDYVVLHEIAHIKHHNHSRDFYALIEKYMPDYRVREKMLKN